VRSVILAGAWLGAAVALASGEQWVQVIAGAGAVAAAFAAYPDRRALFLAGACLGLLALGWFRWQAAVAPPPADSVAWWADGERHTISGRIASRPELRGTVQRFAVQADSVQSIGGTVPVSGSVLVRVSVSRPYRQGDHVRLTGVLAEPPKLDRFDYRAYLARRGVYAVMEFPRITVEGHEPARGPTAWLQALRERGHDALRRGLPAAQAGLAEGILLGRRTDIPRDVNDDFNRAGISHLIVISGFNIALLGGVILGATTWLIGRPRAGIAALLAIALYSVFVGLEPPVARAAVMGGITVLAMLSGRPYGAGVALLIAAAALTMHDPRILTDLSFQLSFAATAGLIVLMPPLQSLGQRLLAEPDRATRPTWRSACLALWDTLAVTLAATVATLPLLLMSFGRLSTVSPLSNLLLAPLFPLLLIAGSIGLAIAMALPSIAWLALTPVGVLLDVSLVVARLCAALPGATLPVTGFTARHALVVYVLLAVAAVGRIPRPRSPNPDVPRFEPVPLVAGTAPLLVFAPAALMAVALIMTLARGPNDDGRTRVDLLNLPGAPAALVSLPAGGRVLVDTGLSPNAARLEIDRILPAGTAAIAAVIITRDAPSAAGGLTEVLDRYRPPLLLVPPDALDAAWAERARESGTTVVALRHGLTIGGSDAHVEVTQSSEAGRWSVRVLHGERSVGLLTARGDAGAGREGQATFLYASDARGVWRVDLRGGDTATIETDGRSLHLRPPRSRSVRFQPCPSSCSGSGAR
jgi:competence protein ComEC